MELFNNKNYQIKLSSYLKFRYWKKVKRLNLLKDPKKFNLHHPWLNTHNILRPEKHYRLLKNIWKYKTLRIKKILKKARKKNHQTQLLKKLAMAKHKHKIMLILLLLLIKKYCKILDKLNKDKIYLGWQLLLNVWEQFQRKKLTEIQKGKFAMKSLSLKFMKKKWYLITSILLHSFFFW